jgi:hypothetical protein
MVIGLTAFRMLLLEIPVFCYYYALCVQLGSFAIFRLFLFRVRARTQVNWFEGVRHSFNPLNTSYKHQRNRTATIQHSVLL